LSRRRCSDAPDNAKAKQLRICVLRESPMRRTGCVRSSKRWRQGSSILARIQRAANVVKLAGNFMIAGRDGSNRRGAREVRKSGVDPIATNRMRTSTIFASPVYQGSLWRRNRARSFTHAGFSPSVAAQGIRHVMKTHRGRAAPMQNASFCTIVRLISAIDNRDAPRMDCVQRMRSASTRDDCRPQGTALSKDSSSCDAVPRSIIVGLGV